MVSPLNNNKIDFRISFDESNDEDYTVIYDKNLFSYKIIYVDNLKTDLENDNDNVNMPSFPSLEPTVSYFDDLDYFKDFKKEFPAIVYNDALTSKLDFLTEPTISPQHIDEFNLKDETSLSECDEEEQNVLYFNNLFPFNVIYPDDLKLDTDNDNDEIDIEQPSGDMSVIPLPNVINVDIGAYAQGMQYGVSLGLGYGVLTTCTDLAIKKSTIWYTLKKTYVELVRAFRRLINTLLLNNSNWRITPSNISVRRSLPYVVLHPNPWLNSNEDVIELYISILSLRPCMYDSAALLVCSSGEDVYPCQAFDMKLITTEQMSVPIKCYTLD
ncbi:hypothetical protein Tco_0666566 [Tanacetum coccineum]